MKHCPNVDCPHAQAAGVSGEFRDDMKVCTDCGTLLVDGPAIEVEIASDEPNLVTIAQYVSPSEAHLDRARIESLGIPAFVFGDTLIGFETMIEGGSIRLQVPEGRADKAMTILTHARLKGPDAELIDEHDDLQYEELDDAIELPDESDFADSDPVQTPKPASSAPEAPHFGHEPARCPKCGGELEPARRLFGLRIGRPRCRFCGSS